MEHQTASEQQVQKSKRSNRSDLIKHAVFFLVLGAIVGVEFAYRKGLYDISVDIMLYL
jgi:membrane-associated phospholipid phosphatase